jgi:Leucine-rich repeat (LRR) protein
VNSSITLAMSSPSIEEVKDSLSDVCRTLDGKEWVLGNSNLSGKGYTSLGEALSSYCHLRYLDASGNELGSLETLKEDGDGEEENGGNNESTESGEERNEAPPVHALQALTGLTSLLAVNLSGNSIISFPKELNLPNIQIVNASGNRITNIPFNATATPVLTTLDISENSLVTVEGMDGMSSLQNLKINDNSVISSLSGLGNLPSLESINASNCDLQDLIGLDGLSNKFTKLNVSGNKISSLNGIITADNDNNLTGLSSIDLSNNSIESIDELVHLSKLSNLQSVDFSGNPCADIDEYRTEVVLRLPNIKSIDGQDVTSEEIDAAKALKVQREEEAAAAEAAAAEAEAEKEDE